MKAPHSKSTIQVKNGFALILSLGAMALIVLLVVTFSLLIQVESSVAEQQRNIALARQNALVGAMLAVGVLQEKLGPDMRVTARADINVANIVNPYWVGVWSTESISGNSATVFNSSHSQLGLTPMRWLVSMTTESSGDIAKLSDLKPSESIDQNVRVQLMKSPSAVTGSLGSAVTVARVPIIGGDRLRGGYAWWVSDEGMKASLQLDGVRYMDKNAELNGLSQGVRRARRTLLPTRLGVEAISCDDSGQLRGNAVSLSGIEEKRLKKMSSSRELIYLAELQESPVAFSEERANDLWHDLTGVSMGVLSSTLETTSDSTLKVDLSLIGNSTSSPLQMLFGDSGIGIWEYLNAYRTFTISNGIPAFPLCPTVPNDGKNAVKGKAYFSIAPVLAEFRFAWSMFTWGGIISGKTYFEEWPVDTTVPSGYFGLQARNYVFSKLWNPYSTAISPQNGHLQLRIKRLPDFRLHYWYNATADKSNPIWKENDISGSTTSDWLNVQEKLKSSMGDKDYIGLHLLNQASTSANPFLYFGGDTSFWFGIRPEAGSSNEYLSGCGAAKEFFNETDRSLIHAYYQSFGAQTSIAWTNGADIRKIRMPIYPKKNLPVGSVYLNKPMNAVWDLTAVTLEWKSSTPILELWWVPDGDSLTGNINSAVLLSSMQMPQNSVVKTPPLNGEILDPKYSPSNPSSRPDSNERCALHYVRKDSSDSSSSEGRVTNDWFMNADSIDPRAPQQKDDAFDFLSSNDPNEYYTHGKLNEEVAIYPDINSTLTRQLDKRGGALKSGAGMTSAEIANYISSLSAGNVLTSTGDSSPARKNSLFEIPTSAPVSLGVLQNVMLGGRRPFCIGNSWGRAAGISGENVNTVFDQAYLSGLTISDLSRIDPALPIANVHLLPLWLSNSDAPASVNSEDVLSYFLVIGAFNVNSTSKEAWKSFLGGGWIEDWDYVQIPQNPSSDFDRSTARLSLHRAVLRFSHTGDETFSAPDNMSDMGVVNGKYYRRGVRRLSNAQLEAMATIIVAIIKSRNGPYGSIAEFLSAPVPGVIGNPSVLEYAVNPSDAWSRNIYSEKGAEFPYNWASSEMLGDGEASGAKVGTIDLGAPADITQAALLNTIAPLLQARSDTFKIRAYGDVQDVSGKLATALCEMTVQRMPDPVKDKSVSANRKKPGVLGRKFVVLSIKWITDF